MQTIQHIKETIRTIISSFFRDIDLQDDQDIFALGFINSLFAMQLVLSIEKEYGITIENEELIIDNFRSINDIAHLIERTLVLARKAERKAEDGTHTPTTAGSQEL